jgi:tRNA-uridine 2-sulfurtransferase
MATKAVSLLSGGLDSLLATKLVLDQGVEVIGLHFVSFLCDGIQAERKQTAQKGSRDLGIRLILRDKGPEFVEMVKKPAHGYGKNLNPCIDCKIFMLRAARDIMDAEGADFVITGEVLGQRPMSQMRHTIAKIERESGLDGLILRPLSAKLFPPSKAEQGGLIDREKLLAISGRSRKEQFALAATHGLQSFGTPAGGCLLTDPIYSRKLADLLNHEPFSMKDVALLRMGRHFRIGGVKLVLGRNQSENQWLQSFWASPFTLVYPVGFKGPTGIYRGVANQATKKGVAAIIAFYGKEDSGEATFEFFDGRPTKEMIEIVRINPEEFRIKEES